MAFWDSLVRGAARFGRALAKLWGLLLLIALWVTAVLVLLMAGLHAIDEADELASKRSPALRAAQDDNPCELQETGDESEDPPPAEGEATVPELARATLTLRENATTTIAFGRGTGEQVREFDYDIVDPDGALAEATCLLVEVGPFTRDTADAQLEQTRISAEATLTGNRALVLVSFDRTQAALGDPGTYTGMVRIIDPRVERTDVTLQVTMAYPFWQLPLALFALMLLPAISYLWLLKGSFGRSPRLRADKFQEYVFSRNGILAIGAGTVAATGIFSATYLSGLTWGSNVVQSLTLFGSAFAAFAAAATAVAAAGTDTSGSRGEAETGLPDAPPQPPPPGN